MEEFHRCCHTHRLEAPEEGKIAKDSVPAVIVESIFKEEFDGDGEKD